MVGPAPPPADDEQGPPMPMNRKQRRMQERETRKESAKEGRRQPRGRARPGQQASGSATPVPQNQGSGPSGAKKRVVAENGKVLVVDEAHKVCPDLPLYVCYTHDHQYLGANKGMSGLTKELLSLVRQLRHQGTRVIISTQCVPYSAAYSAWPLAQYPHRADCHSAGPHRPLRGVDPSSLLIAVLA